MSTIRCILTDIEGTTSSVSFVYDVLFPYFRAHAQEALQLNQTELQLIFEQTRTLAKQENKLLLSAQDCIEQLIQWSLEDRKITPLKQLQGIVWEAGYKQGKLKGHVYVDVPVALKKWKSQGLTLAVYSSGSVKAQKLLFGFSEYGDLTPYFSAYFDTEVGHKREVASYAKIAIKLGLNPEEILFLSDIEEELAAATDAGMHVCQLIRTGTVSSTFYPHVTTFSDITTP